MTGQQRDRGSSRREARRLERERQAKRRRLLIIGGAIGAGLALALVLFLITSLSGDDEPITVAAAPSQPTNGRVLGDPNAPVKIVEWGDYQ